MKLPPTNILVPSALKTIALTAPPEFGSQGRTSPDPDVLNAASLLRVVPRDEPTVVKLPPTYNVTPSLLKTRVLTAPPILGFQVPSTTPVAELIAANLLRGVPPIFVKLPPTYTTLPLTAIALTVPSAFGFHGCRLPLLLILANLLRVSPFTAVKSPPIYQPPLPSETDTLTSPFGLANPAAASPVKL